MFLFNQSRYFQNLLESLPVGTLIFNAAGNMYATNGMAATMLGVERQQALEQGWELLLAGVRDPQELVELLHLTEAERRGEEDVSPGSTAIRFQRPDGQELHLNASRSLLREYGKTFGIMLTLTDVTAVHDLYERERAALRENARMQEKQAQRLRQFSMAVAHQVRNPLQIIGGYARILERKLNGSEVAGPYLEGILEGGDRLAEVVDAVARYSGVSLGQLTEVGPGGVRGLVESAHSRNMEQHRNRAGTSPDLTWQMQIEGSTAGMVLAVDRELLIVALAELFANARDFCQAEAVCVRIRAWVEKERLHLATMDSGPGIVPDLLEFLFDPFYTTKAVGVGMGLCLAERIVREHGGRLSMGNVQEEGWGACAVIELPLERRSQTQ